MKEDKFWMESIPFLGRVDRKSLLRCWHSNKDSKGGEGANQVDIYGLEWANSNGARMVCSRNSKEAIVARVSEQRREVGD